MSKKINRIAAIILSISLIFQQAGFAQIAAQLDMAGYFKGMQQSFSTDKFCPAHLRYFSYNSLNNEFKVLLDKGTQPNNPSNSITQPTQELLRYFLIGVTLPDDKFWVNLRPDAADNIIDNDLAKTDIGKIFLETDLELKKDTARLTSPQTPEGKLYWDKLYKKAEELFGSDQINIPTLTRPWIVPNEVIVRQSNDSVYIYKATMKVMLEEDYLKQQSQNQIVSNDYSFSDPRLKELNKYSTQLVKDLILPKLTRMVNTSKKYSGLRQVFYSLVLARWFKSNFSGRSGTYSSLINKSDLRGLTSSQAWSKDTYFKDYQKSFKDGEYNLKVSVNGISGQVIRNYFSGGIQFTSSPVSGVGRASSGITNALLKAPGTELLSGAPSQITLIPSSVQALSSSSVLTQTTTVNYGRIIIEISKNEGEELTEVKFGFRDANGKDNGQRIATALNTHRKFDVNDAASEIMENLRNRINLQQADGLESFIDLAKLSLPAVIRDLYPVSGLKAWQKVSSPVSSAVRSVEAVRPLTNLLYQVGLKSDPEGFGYLAFEEDGHYKGAPRFGQLMRDALDIIYKFARRHFGHNYQNYKGDVITVGIGIGGQTTCALPEEGYVVKHNNRRLIVADSLGTDFNAMEEKLLSSLRKNTRTKLLWKVSSKSGQTDETMINFQMVLRMMIRIWARFNYGDEKGIVIADNLIKRMFDGKPLAEKNISELNLSEEERDILKIVFSNMIMTTGKFDQVQKKGSRLDQFRNGFLKQLFAGNENEVASILMLDNLGGRFQGVSPASLTYAVLLGMDAEEILAGAREEAKAQRAGTSESAKFAEELYRRDIHHFVITAPNGLVFSRPTELLEQLIPESTGKGRKIGMPQGLQTYNFDPAHVRQAFSNIPGIERKAYFVIDLEGQEPIDVGAGPNDLVIRYKMKSVSERELGKYIQFVENLTVRYGMLTTAEVLREKQKADKSLQEVDLSNSANIAKIMQGPKQGDVQFDALKKLHEFFNEITPFRQPDVEGAKALVKQGRGFNAFNENGEKDESGLPVRSEAQRGQAYEENEILVSDGAFLRPNGLRNGGDFVTGPQARGVLTALVDMLKKPSAPVDARVIRMEHIRGFLKQLEEMLQREPLGVPLNEFFQMVDKEKEMKRLLDLILQSTTQVKLTQTEEQTARQLAALRLKADKSGKTFNFVLYEDRNSLTEIFKKYLAFLGFDRFGFCPGEQHKSRQLTAGGVDVSLEVLMVSLKTLAKVKDTETLIKSDGNVPVYLHDLFPSEVSDIYAKAYADRFNEVGTESVTMLVPDATDVNKLVRLMVVFARSKQIYDQQYAASSAVEAKQVAEEFLIENLGGVLTRDDFVRLRQETKYTSEALAEAIVAAAFENNLLLTKNGGGFVITEMKNNGSVPMVNDWRALDQKQNNDKIKQEEKMRTLASQIVEAFSSKQKLTPKNSMFSSNGRLVQTFLLQRKGQVVPVEDLNRFIQVSNLNPEGFADAVVEVVSRPQARIVVEIRSKGLRISQGAGSLSGEAVTKGQILRLLNPKSTQGPNGQTSKVEDANLAVSSAVALSSQLNFGQVSGMIASSPVINEYQIMKQPQGALKMAVILAQTLNTEETKHWSQDTRAEFARLCLVPLVSTLFNDFGRAPTEEETEEFWNLVKENYNLPMQELNKISEFVNLAVKGYVHDKIQNLPDQIPGRRKVLSGDDALSMAVHRWLINLCITSDASSLNRDKITAVRMFIKFSKRFQERSISLIGSSDSLSIFLKSELDKDQENSAGGYKFNSNFDVIYEKHLVPLLHVLRENDLSTNDKLVMVLLSDITNSLESYLSNTVKTARVSSAISYQELQDKLSDVLRQWVWNENSGQRIDVFIKLDNMQVQSAGTLRMGFNKNQIDIDKACESILNKISQEYKTAESLIYKVERRKNLGIVIDVVLSSSSAVKPTILIVEDGEGMREGLEAFLGTFGYNVIAVASGEDALSLLESQMVDFVLTDYKLTKMNGLLFLNELKKRGKWPVNGAILMSGSPDSNLSRLAEEAGAKFFPKEEYRKMVEEVRKAVPTASSAVDTKDVGGIDLRSINIITQPMGNFAKLNLQLPQADRNMDIDDELRQINKMLEAGIRPNSQRFAMVASSCIQRKELSRHAQDLALAVVKTYKLDEANSVESDEDLMKVSLLVDSI
jgi:CheY-like chemotaxis protein